MISRHLVLLLVLLTTLSISLRYKATHAKRFSSEKLAQTLVRSKISSKTIDQHDKTWMRKSRIVLHSTLSASGGELSRNGVKQGAVVASALDDTVLPVQPNNILDPNNPINNSQQQRKSNNPNPTNFITKMFYGILLAAVSWSNAAKGGLNRGRISAGNGIKRILPERMQRVLEAKALRKASNSNNNDNNSSKNFVMRFLFRFKAFVSTNRRSLVRGGFVYAILYAISRYMRFVKSLTTEISFATFLKVCFDY